MPAARRRRQKAASKKPSRGRVEKSARAEHGELSSNAAACISYNALEVITCRTATELYHHLI